MQVLVTPAVAQWYANHRKARAVQTGHNRNYYAMLPVQQKERLISHLCEIYHVPMPVFTYDRDRFAHKTTGRNVDYDRGRLYSIRTPTFGKHLCWVFYLHYMWANYQLDANSTPLDMDQQDPAEVFADRYWRELSRQGKEF